MDVLLDLFIKQRLGLGATDPPSPPTRHPSCPSETRLSSGRGWAAGPVAAVWSGAGAGRAARVVRCVVGHGLGGRRVGCGVWLAMGWPGGAWGGRAADLLGPCAFRFYAILLTIRCPDLDAGFEMMHVCGFILFFQRWTLAFDKSPEALASTRSES